MKKKRKKFFEKLKESEKHHKPDRAQSNKFKCQQITVKSPLYGDIMITKDYFLFVSFGLSTPNKVVYAKK